MKRAIRVALLAAGLAALVALVRQVGATIVADLLRRTGPALAIVSALYLAHLAMRAAALWRNVLAQSSSRKSPPSPWRSRNCTRRSTRSSSWEARNLP